MTEEQKKYLIDLNGMLFFKSEQDKENLEKFIKKDEALSSLGAISYLVKQNLTESQKAQARENIGAGTGDGTGSAEGAVRYDKQQSLEEEDKIRARENIGAGTSNFDGDYNSLSNRTHYKEGVEITWDGNTEGLESVSAEAIGVTGGAWYKVQNTPLNIEQLMGGSLYMYNSTVGDIHQSIKNISEENIMQGDFGQTVFTGVVMQSTPALVNVVSAGSYEITEGVTLTFNSVGVYLLEINESTVSRYTGLVSSPITYHKLDVGFIPDSIPRLDENGKLSIDNMPDLGFYDDVVEGYFNSENNLFYQEAEFTTTIMGESGKIYVDLLTSNSYRFSGSIFIRINPDEYTIATNEQILALFN